MSNNPMALQEVSNRNFLALGGFKLKLNRCPKVDFLCNKANLPTITLGVAQQTSYLKNIPVPGDKMSFDDLVVSFIVDENLENYLQIYDWMTGLGFPESLQQFEDIKRKSRYFPEFNEGFNERSDGTLMVLNSNYNTVAKVKFKDLFPFALTGIPFDATLTQEQFFTATVSFKYTIFDMIDNEGDKV
tara:strand:- start:2487 stop:3047 length:561 start_codon:yes stop_codon:yes gene_type:complete